MGENRFLYRGIKYNIFGLIPKTSYITQTLNIKYRSTIEPWATSRKPLTCRKSLTNFITKCCIEYTSLYNMTTTTTLPSGKVVEWKCNVKRFQWNLLNKGKVWEAVFQKIYIPSTNFFWDIYPNKWPQTRHRLMYMW